MIVEIPHLIQGLAKFRQKSKKTPRVSNSEKRRRPKPDPELVKEERLLLLQVKCLLNKALAHNPHLISPMRAGMVNLLETAIMTLQYSIDYIDESQDLSSQDDEEYYLFLVCLEIIEERTQMYPKEIWERCPTLPRDCKPAEAELNPQYVPRPEQCLNRQVH